LSDCNPYLLDMIRHAFCTIYSMYCFLLIITRTNICFKKYTRRNNFEVSKYFVRYRSENNFVRLSK